MQLLAVGLNHTTAPLSIREKVAFSPEQIAQAVIAAREWFAKDQHAPQYAPEAAILSTCNRTEMYAASHIDNPIDATAHFWRIFMACRIQTYADICTHCRKTMLFAMLSA